MSEMPSIYHFTCDHGYAGIGDQGVVKPNWHPMLGESVSWFTDLDQPDRDAVGLTSESGLIACDRMAYRYRVIDAEAYLKLYRWIGSTEQARTELHWQADLHRFSKPEHWWIATKPILVTLDVRSALTGDET